MKIFYEFSKFRVHDFHFFLYYQWPTRKLFKDGHNFWQNLWTVSSSTLTLSGIAIWHDLDTVNRIKEMKVRTSRLVAQWEFIAFRVVTGNYNRMSMSMSIDSNSTEICFKEFFIALLAFKNNLWEKNRKEWSTFLHKYNENLWSHHDLHEHSNNVLL